MHTEPVWQRELTLAQREVAFQKEGPVLVAAGPGTGKTKTLLARLFWLLQEQRVPAEAIVVMTFTRKAAREVRERLERTLGGVPVGLFVGTLHGFAYEVLRRTARSSKGGPRVLTQGEQEGLLRQVLSRYAKSRSSPTQILEAFSRWRNTHPLGDLARDPQWGPLYRDYQSLLQQAGAVDYEGLLEEAIRQWEQIDPVPGRWSHFLVDEFQDLTPLQRTLVRCLARVRPQGLWVVGDLDQCIYGFRGAKGEGLLHFTREWRGGRIFYLEETYRLPQVLVRVATRVIARNPHRFPLRLRSVREEGPPVRLVEVPDEEAEAFWIIRELEEQVGGTHHLLHLRDGIRDPNRKRTRSFRDFAILVRLQAQMRSLEAALRRAGIPVQRVTEKPLILQKPIRDLLAYLRPLADPQSPPASWLPVLEVPPRGLGPRTRERLLRSLEALGRQSLWDLLAHPPNLPRPSREGLESLRRLFQDLKAAAAQKSLSRWLQQVVEQSGLGSWYSRQDPRIQDGFRLLLNWAVQYDSLPAREVLSVFLEDLLEVQGADLLDPRADAVTLLTLHSAKGLEFPEVFVCGLEEGIFPLEGESVEEERRLFYVGLTRAQTRVTVIRAHSRFLYGERRTRAPSRFLEEMGSEGVEPCRFFPNRERVSRCSRPTQMDLFG